MLEDPKIGPLLHPVRQPEWPESIQVHSLALKPMFVAVHEHNLHDLRCFIQENMDLDIQDNFGRTPLMLAAQLGHADICVYLLTSGANAKLGDLRGIYAHQFPGVSASLQALLLALQGENFEVRSLDKALEELQPHVQQLVENKLESIATMQESQRHLQHRQQKIDELEGEHQNKLAQSIDLQSSNLGATMEFAAQEGVSDNSHNMKNLTESDAVSNLQAEIDKLKKQIAEAKGQNSEAVVEASSWTESAYADLLQEHERAPQFEEATNQTSQYMSLNEFMQEGQYAKEGEHFNMTSDEEALQQRHSVAQLEEEDANALPGSNPYPWKKNLRKNLGITKRVQFLETAEEVAIQDKLAGHAPSEANNDVMDKSEDATTEGADWTCKECNSDNPCHLMICEFCDTPRGTGTIAQMWTDVEYRQV